MRFKRHGRRKLRCAFAQGSFHWKSVSGVTSAWSIALDFEALCDTFLRSPLVGDTAFLLGIAVSNLLKFFYFFKTKIGKCPHNCLNIPQPQLVMIMNRIGLTQKE